MRGTGVPSSTHRGLPWGTGAVSEAAWTGVSLGDLLRRAGIAPDAVEVVLRGADSGAGEHPGVHAYARSLPIEKALHPTPSSPSR